MDQVSLWHKVKYRLSLERIVLPHVEEEVRLLANFVDTVDVVVNLMGLELLHDSRPPDLSPDQIHKLHSGTLPCCNSIVV